MSLSVGSGEAQRYELQVTHNAATALYWASAGTEVAALACVVTDIIRARKRASQFRYTVSKELRLRWGVDGGTVAEAQSVEGEGARTALDLAVIHQEVDDIKRTLARRTPQVVAYAVEEAQRVAARIEEQTAENLRRLAEAADVTGKRRLALLGAFLLFVAIGLSLAGNLVSVGAR